MAEAMGVATDIQVGLRDTYSPCLWFTAKAISGSSLQRLTWEEAEKFLADANITNLRDVQVVPIVVDETDSHVIYVRVAT
jgi:hypothetical protein